MSTQTGCEPLPLRISANTAGTRDLLHLAAARRDELRALLTSHGAILFSGFDVPTVEAFRRAFCALVSSPIGYVEQSSARTEVGEGIYTSTEYPSEREILLHNEQSYNMRFPRFISFFCERPADRNGETPLADTRRVLNRLDPKVVQRLAGTGYLYVRNFGGSMQMTWQKAFQVRDADALATYCDSNDIAFAWLGAIGGPRLRTVQRRNVMARHPDSKELVWFNHATFFHESSLDADLRQMLRELCGPDSLPHATYCGDGTGLEADTMALLRDAYRQEETTFEWRAGDVLIVDNMLVAHGRRSFQGPRRVLVSMAELCHWSAVMPAYPGHDSGH